MRRAVLSGWVVMVLVLGAGCGSTSGSGEDRAEEPTATSPTPTPSSPTSAGPVESAVADLAERLEVDPAKIEVVAEEQVTWRDGSLGCATPGNVYSQALVEGSRITLRVDGTDYAYHSGGSAAPFWCEQPTE